MYLLMTIIASPFFFWCRAGASEYDRQAGNVFLGKEDRERLEHLVDSYGNPEGADTSSNNWNTGDSANNLNLFTEFLSYGDKVS